MPNPDVMNDPGVAAETDAPAGTDVAATDSGDDLGSTDGEGAGSDSPNDGQTSEDEYEVNGITFTASQIKKWADLDKNYKNWDAAHHKKGMELNKRERDFLEKTKTFEKDLAAGKEYAQLRRVMDANPAVREYIAKLIADPQSQVAVMMRDMEEKFTSREKQAQEREAIAELKAEMPDFDYDSSQQILQQFDWDNPKDVLKASHYLRLGMNLDKVVEQKLIKAGQIKAKAPKVPPLAGARKAADKPRKFKSLDEAMEQFNRDNPQ